MGAPAAMADDVGVLIGVTSCPSDGNPGGGQRCTTIGNGVLSVRGNSGNSYYTVNYYRSGGGSLTARNGVERSGTNTWAGYRNMSNTPFHYENSFTLGASCSSVIGKLNTTSGDTYPTPPLPRC
jgi:lipid-binding SYLF domain-containing protein